jgi:hypothetical protein
MGLTGDQAMTDKQKAEAKKAQSQKLCDLFEGSKGHLPENGSRA